MTVKISDGLDQGFIPEIRPQGVTGAKLRKILADMANYNAASRTYQPTDPLGREIPAKYRGRNRYFKADGHATDNEIGEYGLYYIYDLDPEVEGGKTLIAIYFETDKEGQKLQTQAQIEKYWRAAQLEADRQERMVLSDPALVQKLKIDLPRVLRPAKGREKITKKILDERLASSNNFIDRDS